MACESSGIRQSYKMSLLTYFTSEPGKAVLSRPLYFKSKKDHQYVGKLKVYCQVFNYSLSRYASNDVIAKPEVHVANSK